MKYGVNKEILLITAGTVWIIAGANILRIGIVTWLNNSEGWMFKIGEATIVFLLFFVLIFKRLYYKHTQRIERKKEQKNCPFSFFDVKSWIVMIFMICMGITIRSFGHAGDGNLHIYCCANDMELDEFKRRSKAVMDKCYAKCIEFGGQVSGEHAIGHAKKQYLVESAGETAFGLMQAIKQVFDPKGILNPGKVCTNVEEG